MTKDHCKYSYKVSHIRVTVNGALSQNEFSLFSFILQEETIGQMTLLEPTVGIHWVVLSSDYGSSEDFHCLIYCVVFLNHFQYDTLLFF